MISTLGHTTKLTGNTYRAFATTRLSETTDRGPQLIAVPNGKKVKDWAIRSQAPKSAMIRIWGRFNDLMIVGLRGLITPDEGLR